MNLYSYDGPVKEFDNIVMRRWKATTYAVSEKKARCNLMFRIKRELKRTPDAKITLPGKITLVNNGGER
jgi:hypothetical protein